MSHEDGGSPTSSPVIQGSRPTSCPRSGSRWALDGRAEDLDPPRERAFPRRAVRRNGTRLAARTIRTRAATTDPPPPSRSCSPRPSPGTPLRRAPASCFPRKPSLWRTSVPAWPRPGPRSPTRKSPDFPHVQTHAARAADQKSPVTSGGSGGSQHPLGQQCVSRQSPDRCGRPSRNQTPFRRSASRRVRIIVCCSAAGLAQLA